MHLPCPHCKETFRIDPAGIPTRAARLKCPACGGLFRLQNSLDPQVDPNRSSCSSRLAPSPTFGNGEPAPATAAGSGAAGAAIETGLSTKGGLSGEAGGPEFRKNRSSAKLWLLLPAFGLLIAAMGILMPAARPGTEGTDQKAYQSVRRPPAELESTGPGPLDPRMPVSNPAGDKKQPTASDLSLFLGMGMADPCQVTQALREPTAPLQKGDACRGYPYWIAYLSSEKPAQRSCPIDAIFSETSQALGNQSLCAEGYAFLAAYYVQKRIADRSQKFLEEARQRSAGGLWVKWVEVLYSLRILQDKENAGVLLKDLVAGFPDFTLARYFLAKLQVQDEDYDEAEGSFAALQGRHPDQTEFREIRDALTSLRQASSYSTQRAAGLLILSRSFLSLQEFGFAETILVRVMEGMPGRLSEEDQKTGFLLLGRLHELRGDKEGAYNSYQEALRIDPRFPDARKRLEELLGKNKEHS